MALKSFNPITPSLRELVQVDKSALWKGRPHKPLTEGIHKTGGRNNQGRTTIWHRGGGHKRLYRTIDFKRNKFDVFAVVGSYTYIIAPQKLNVGDKIISSESADIKVGNCLSLKSIPVGTVVHNVEMKPGKGGQLARSAGSSVQLAGKDSGYAQIKLRSGELRLVPLECLATVGAVSNQDHQNVNYGKAGRMRWLGRRPVVRGVAMNPVDHPHGGGEGKTSGGRHPVTPWGKSTKGKKTRRNKSTSKYIIKRRK
jgi:large subunit ribosomal protein L2